MIASEKALIGAAGEHYILFQLLRRGLHASLAPQNAYAADIVVFGPSMSEGFMVQVKTRTSRQGRGWVMSAKHEGIVHPRLFYAFLDLAADVPVTFLMPSAALSVHKGSRQTALDD